MVGHGGSSAGSYLADPTSPIPSHCASIVATSTVRVNYQLFIVGLCDCSPGFYGAHCENHCTGKCKKKECHQVTGFCAKGCEYGYWGQLCDKTCKCQVKCDQNTGKCLDGKSL